MLPTDLMLDPACCFILVVWAAQSFFPLFLVNCNNCQHLHCILGERGGVFPQHQDSQRLLLEKSEDLAAWGCYVTWSCQRCPVQGGHAFLSLPHSPAPYCPHFQRPESAYFLLLFSLDLTTSLIYPVDPGLQEYAFVVPGVKEQL